MLNASFEQDYEKFVHLLLSKLENHSPLTRPPKSKKNIYMNPEALRLKNRKWRAWRRYRASRSQYDRNIYIRLKNELRSLTRNLRENFEQTFTSAIKSKPKMFWKYAKSRLKTRQTIPTLIKSDGSNAITDEEKAEALNCFFTSVFTNEDLSSIPPLTLFQPGSCSWSNPLSKKANILLMR